MRSDTFDADGYVRNTFRVRLTDFRHPVVDVRATYWEIQNGALVFMLSGPGSMTEWIMAFGDGQWISVERVLETDLEETLRALRNAAGQ